VKVVPFAEAAKPAEGHAEREISSALGDDRSAGRLDD